MMYLKRYIELHPTALTVTIATIYKWSNNAAFWLWLGVHVYYHMIVGIRVCEGINQILQWIKSMWSKKVMKMTPQLPFAWLNLDTLGYFYSQISYMNWFAMKFKNHQLILICIIWLQFYEYVWLQGEKIQWKVMPSMVI